MKENNEVSACESCYSLTHTIDGKCGKCGAKKMPENKPETFEQTVTHNCEGYISPEWINEILVAHKAELARARAEVHKQYRPLVELCEQRVKDECSWCETKDAPCKTCFENELKSALAKAKGE